MELLLLFGVLFGLMLLGVPIFISMLFSAVVTLAVTGLGGGTIIPTQMISGVSASQLMAIPFFILMGEFMSHGGLTQRIIDLLMYFFGRVRGGLAFVVVGVNAFAASVVGSAPAAATMIGSTMVPVMEKQGYKRSYAAAVNASSTVLSPIIPPSVPLIFLSLVTSLSLGQLFIGGVGPGILLAAALFIIVATHARRGRLPERISADAEIQIPLRKLFIDALPALGAPVFIMVGVIAGFVTITEVAILSALYTLVMGLLLKQIKVREIFGILRKSGQFSSTIMMLFAAVGGFTFIIAVQRVGDQIAALAHDMNLTPLGFLFLAMLFFLFVGTILDAIPAILIFIPILMPVALSVGVDPIHFGVIVVVNLMIGLITPPVGALLFILMKIGKVSFGSLVRDVLPFFVSMLIALILTILFPALVTWLPDLLLHDRDRLARWVYTVRATLHG